MGISHSIILYGWGIPKLNIEKTLSIHNKLNKGGGCMQKTMKKTDIAPYIGIIPSLLMFGLFILYPAITNFYYSMTKFDGVTVQAFIGFDNFVRAFKSDLLYNAIKNSFIYAILITAIQNILAVSFAILLSLKVKGSNFFRALYFFPNTMGAFSVAIIWGILMDFNFGSITYITKLFGLNVTFFGNENSIYTIIFIQVWISLGYAMTIYYSNIMSIPQDLYEAADIDGAGFFLKVKSIVFPLIAPSITINIMLSIIGSLKLFDIIYVSTQGGPMNSTENLPVLIFNQAFSFSEHGYGAALNVIQFFIIISISLVTMKFRKRSEVDM